MSGLSFSPYGPFTTQAPHQVYSITPASQAYGTMYPPPTIQLSSPAGTPVMTAASPVLPAAQASSPYKPHGGLYSRRNRRSRKSRSRKSRSRKSRHSRRRH
jgi:hypothetical protein